MGLICASPASRNNRARARQRLHSMAISTMDAHGHHRHHHHHHHHASPLRGHSAMSIGHLTKINTLVMVGPAEANFMGASPAAAGGGGGDANGAPLFRLPAALLFSRDALARAKITLELSMRQHTLIEKYWRDHIAHKHRDIFHRTMLNVIEASPKVNEVIACQRYCFRDLTKWPKLNRICQAQFSFYERLIFTLNLNEEKLLGECTRLGQIHAQYAQYGLKPHFLDIFQHQFLALLEKIEVENEAEKREMIGAFSILTSFILDVFNHSYSLKMSEFRLNERTAAAAAAGGAATGTNII